MRLLDLTLRDFGVYQGINTINIKPIGGPIVIIGGKNGAGKTTILEAVRLCLYGPRALGDHVSRRKYDEYIIDHIHHQSNVIVPVKFASVELHFEYSQFGTFNQYRITRAWEMKANGVYEQLYIKVDDEPLTNIPEERWQEFIDDIIPLGVANLFFFDSEKIQSLAADDLGDQTLGEEIKRLLDVNIIERLHSDLDTYSYKQRREQALPELLKNLDMIQANRNKIESHYQAKRQDRAQTQTWMDQIQSEIERMERRIHQESSGYALTRENLKKELASIDAEITQIEREIHISSAGLLPFALVPELSNQLRNNLQIEAEFEQRQGFNALVQSKVTAIKGKFHEDSFWKDVNGDLSSEERDLIIHQVESLLDELIKPEVSSKKTNLIHGLSEKERLQLLNWIEQAQTNVPEKIKTAGERLEQLEKGHEEINVQLHMVPDDDVLRPLIEELNEQYKKFGKLEAIAARQDQELSSLEYQREEASRKLEKAFSDLRGGKALERRLDLVVKTQKVLDVFLQRMVKEKIGKLETLIADRFNDLSRKPDLVKRIEIDPEEFTVTLIGRDERPVPKTRLSAGEKQLFAISTLWALRQLSGRPLPMVIDTPLARLDSDHRMNLVKRYFPYSSHQMILLSTDTEIDREYFDALQPHISHAYQLNYDPKTGSTLIRRGYFWNEAENATE